MAGRRVWGMGRGEGRAMASARQQQILIVEDDLDLSEMLAAYFSVQGYKVLTAAWGEEAVKLCEERPPDLVVLDIRLPDIDGYEIARRLQGRRRTKDVPIIFLTERRDRVDKLAGLELGVVDYVTKPFDIQELRLRIRNVLRRAGSRQWPENQVTGLPEGALVDERLEKLLSDRSPWAVLVVRLRGLGRFRERYGFVACDDVLRAVGLMIGSAMAEAGEDGKGDFLGHLAREVLVIVTARGRLEQLKKRILERAGSAMDYFYPFKDREAREGEERLALWAGSLRASDGPFKDVDAFKEALLKAPAPEKA